MTVHTLAQAESPAKADMLELVEMLRTGVESGDILALVALPIHTNMEFSTKSAGEIKVLALSGILGRAWLDANELLKK